jgi:hypothetical protein
MHKKFTRPRPLKPAGNVHFLNDRRPLRRRPPQVRAPDGFVRLGDSAARLLKSREDARR